MEALMFARPRAARVFVAVLLLSLVAAAAPAQAPAPAATAPAIAPTPPPSPVSGIRNKLSAGDLLSAESVLEVHREKNGEDGPWLQGLAWLARGAFLLGDMDKAERYAHQVRDECAKRLARGDTLARNHDLETALGAAIETDAQRLERTKGKKAAAEMVRAELARYTAPPTLLMRLHKRLAMLTLAGTPAPEWVTEDFVGETPPSLASLKGKPVVLFLWFEGCGDCKAQAASLGRALEKRKGTDLRCVAITRYYEDPPARAAEKARIDSVWTAVYAGVGPIPRVISTASMIAYGVSSTPTFVFIDRKGIVRRYTPTRLTEAELDRSLDAITR
jgi:cytochrome c biogenesis protein CcmG/thiol:disulfide interchange protein DsbE